MTRRDLYDALMVGAVERVRPKMMTVFAITPAVIETRRFYTREVPLAGIDPAAYECSCAGYLSDRLITAISSDILAR
jgi:hypothetical protein